MPRCRLSFALERNDARFRAGETVRGSLEVFVEDDCTCNGLGIDMGYRTQGKGALDERWMHAMPLAGGETWKAGDTRSYSFEMRTPSGLVSYDGQLVQVRWFLAARASLAWARDAKCETEVFLLRAPHPETEPEPERFSGYREPARRSPPLREERAKKSDGESVTTHRHIVQRARVELAPEDGVVLGAGERRTFQGELQLRANAPPSFNLNNNELRWSAVVCLDAEGVPDWKEEYDLTVA